MGGKIYGSKGFVGEAFGTASGCFADIYNTVVFGGEKIICPDNLKARPTEGIVRGESGMLRTMLRDVCKEDTLAGVSYAILGVENQSGVDYTMPERVMGMDYASYEEEIRKLIHSNLNTGYKAGSRRIKKGQRIAPVITLVLNYGKPWDGPVCLKDMLNIPSGKYQKLIPYIQDYRMNLVNLSELTDEQAEQFQSDFRFLVKYLIHQRDKRGLSRIFEKDERVVKHPKETMLAIAAITKDARYLGIGEQEEGKENVTMCALYDEIEKRGIDKGIEKGISVFIQSYLQEGRSDTVICEKLQRFFDLTREEAEDYLKKEK